MRKNPAVLLTNVCIDCLTLYNPCSTLNGENVLSPKDSGLDVRKFVFGSKLIFIRQHTPRSAPLSLISRKVTGTANRRLMSVVLILPRVGNVSRWRKRGSTSANNTMLVFNEHCQWQLHYCLYIMCYGCSSVSYTHLTLPTKRIV